MATGKWEEMTAAVKQAFTAKPKKYSEKSEKESTVDQIVRSKQATVKALKEAGAD